MKKRKILIIFSLFFSVFSFTTSHADDDFRCPPGTVCDEESVYRKLMYSFNSAKSPIQPILEKFFAGQERKEFVQYSANCYRDDKGDGNRLIKATLTLAWISDNASDSVFKTSRLYVMFDSAAPSRSVQLDEIEKAKNRLSELSGKITENSASTQYTRDLYNSIILDNSGERPVRYTLKADGKLVYVVANSISENGNDDLPSIACWLPTP